MTSLAIQHQYFLSSASRSVSQNSIVRIYKDSANPYFCYQTTNYYFNYQKVEKEWTLRWYTHSQNLTCHLFLLLDALTPHGSFHRCSHLWSPYSWLLWYVANDWFTDWTTYIHWCDYSDLHICSTARLPVTLNLAPCFHHPNWSWYMPWWANDGVFGFHIRIVRSTELDTRSVPSPENATDNTISKWPLKTHLAFPVVAFQNWKPSRIRVVFPVITFQIRTVLSSAPEPKRVPSSENTTDHTQPEWPFITRSMSPVAAFQTRTENPTRQKLPVSHHMKKRPTIRDWNDPWVQAPPPLSRHSKSWRTYPLSRKQRVFRHVRMQQTAPNSNDCVVHSLSHLLW